MSTEHYLSPKENYTAIVEDFMKRHGLHKVIAFSGGSDENLEGVSDEVLQTAYKKVMQEKQEYIIGNAIRKLQDFPIAILSGGTKWGIPKTVIEKAKEFEIKTIGVYPLIGRKHALSDDLLDLKICVEPYYSESRWGDESSVYAKLLDASVIYGGGAGTLVEVSHILKANEAIIKYGGTPKFIVPISGTGGVADGIPFIWSKTEVRRASMPSLTINSGEEAVSFIIEKLGLFDYMEV